MKLLFSVLVLLVGTHTALAAGIVIQKDVKLQGSFNESEQYLGMEPVSKAAYEPKVYGYTFYSSTTNSANVTRGKIISYFTNDHNKWFGLGDGDTICLTHRWHNGAGEEVFSGDIRIGLEAHTKKRIDLPFEMPLDTIYSVTSWTSEYSKCDKFPDLLIGKAACAVGATVLAVYTGTDPSQTVPYCGKLK